MKHLGRENVTVCLVTLVIAVFTWSSPVRADSATGSIAGVLKDPSGAVVPRGEIRIKNLDTGNTRSTSSNQQGQYRVDTLPAGRYEVSAALPGFETSVRDGIVLTEGQEATVDFRLNLGKSLTVVRVEEGQETVGTDAIVAARARTSDTASLLSDVPGLDRYSSGGISSLPVLHGMADDRVNVLVNGMPLAAACPNHMNPAMSYIDPANLAGITVMAGITPVSSGGDSIGGTIAVESAAPEFAKQDQGVQVHGGFSTAYRTNEAVDGDSAWVSVATANFSVGYIGSYAHAADYKDGAGAMVLSTSYESQNHAARFAVRHGSHLITLDVGYQHIPEEAFANAWMDMVGNEAKLANVHYSGVFGSVKVNARMFYENTAMR